MAFATSLEESGPGAFPLGICPRHGAKIERNGEPVCMKCEGEATPKNPAGVVVAQDPGHDALEALLRKPMGKETLPPSDVVAPVGTQGLQTFKQAVPREGPPRGLGFSGFDGGIKTAVSILESLPMPKDIKQFKAVQKAITTLKKLLEPQGA